MPLISVIVPVYKVEAYLSRCIDSILAQTFTDFELILIDDGSPDNCGKICDDYAKNNSRIFVIHQENGGVSVARNNAIEWALKNSDSQWLTFIDSDDWVHPRYLELLYTAAYELGVDISACEYKDAETISSFSDIGAYTTDKISSEEFYVNNQITAVAPWCKLYKKACFETIRYPVGIRYEDEFTTYKVLFEKSHIAYINEQLYFYYTNPIGFMNSDWSPKRLDVITAHEEQIMYFRKNGFNKALKKIERILLWYIVSQIEITEKSDTYKAFSPKLKKKLKTCIKDYKKDLNLSVKNHPGIYEKAYPKTTKIYWVIVYILKKLKIKRR